MAELGNYRLCFHQMTLTTQGDEEMGWEARQYVDDDMVGTSKGVFWNINCIIPTTILVPNMLHTMSLGTVLHLMDWVISFHNEHSMIDLFNHV